MLKVVLTSKSSGFTLLELLIVIVILAVVSSVVVLAFTDAGRSRTMQATVERIALVLELARTEVTTRNEIWAFHVKEGHYFFKKIDVSTNEWKKMQIRPFQPNRIDEDLRLFATSDREPAQVSRVGQQDIPVVVLYPSGEVSPFRLEVSLEQSEHRVYIESDGFSKIELVEAS